MKRDNILGLIVVTLLAFAFTSMALSDPWIIDGNKVYVNDSKVYISAEPHTLRTSGFVEFEVISKVYTGDVNVILAFSEDVMKPSTIEYYNPHLENVEKSYTCEGGGFGHGIWYNYTLNPKHVWCWANQSSNGTLQPKLIFEHDFDSADLPTNTVYWTEQIEKNWSDLAGNFNKIDKEYNGRDEIYRAVNLPIIAGQSYILRMWIDVDPFAVGKYDMAIYPSSWGNNIQGSISSNQFYLLDPFFNTSFAFRLPILNDSTTDVATVINGTTGFTLGDNLSRQIAWFSGNSSVADPSVYFNNNTDWIVANDSLQLPVDVEEGNVTGVNQTQVYKASAIIINHMNGTGEDNVFSANVTFSSAGTSVPFVIGNGVNLSGGSINVTSAANTWNGGSALPEYTFCTYVKVFSRANTVGFVKIDGESYLEMTMPSDGTIRWRHRESDNTFNEVDVSGLGLPTGNEHICASWDGTDNVTIYHNGVPANDTLGVSDIKTDAGPDPATLGCNVPNCSGDRWNAQWDEWRVYLEKLTDREILDIFNNGITLGPQESVNADPNATFETPTPANGSTVNVDNIFANYTVQDDVGVSTCVLQLDGVNQTINISGNSTSEICFVNLTGLADATYQFKGFVNDTVNSNGSTELRTVTVDAIAPVVTILVPTEGEIFNNTVNITVNYTAVEPSLDVCQYNVTTTDGPSVSNVTIANCDNFTFLAPGIGNVTLNVTANSTGGMIGSDQITFKIPFVVLQNETFPSPEEETVNTSFFMSFNESQDIVANSFLVLTYNGTEFNGTNRTVTGNTAAFNITGLLVPLVATNATTVNLQATYTYQLLNDTNVTTEFSTNTQTIIFAYFIDTVVSSNNPGTELEQTNFTAIETFNADFATRLVNISFNASILPAALDTSGATSNNYTASATLPISNGSALPFNATLFLDFNGFTTSRLSINFNQTINSAGLVQCNGSTITAFNFTYVDEESNTNFTNGASPDNDTFVFEATFDIFQETPGDLLTNVSFNFTGVNSYEICLESNGTSFKTNADIRYFNTSFSTRFHFLDFNDVSNVTQFIKLYLLDDSDSDNVNFKVTEADGITGAPGVVLRALRFYESTGLFENVAMGRTNEDGLANMFLKELTVQYAYQAQREGVILITTERATVDSSAQQVINLGVAALANIYNIFFNVNSTCAVNNATVNCSYTDLTTQLTQMFLTIQRDGVIAAEQVCQNSSTLSADSVFCDVSGSGNGTYYWWLQGIFTQSGDSGSSLIRADTFDIGEDLEFGTEGLMFTAILLMVLVLIGSFNPTVSIFMSVGALVISAAVGMLDISATALIGLIIVAAISAIRQRGGV